MKKKPVYPVGTAATAIHKAIVNHPTLVFTIGDIYDVVKAELPLVKRKLVQNQISWSLKRQGFIISTVMKGAYKATPAFLALTSTPSVLPNDLENDKQFSLLEIGRGIVTYIDVLKARIADLEQEETSYVDVLKAKIEDLEQEVIDRTTQLNELQSKFNETKMSGGLCVKEIMNGGN